MKKLCRKIYGVAIAIVTFVAISDLFFERYVPLLYAAEPAKENTLKDYQSLWGIDRTTRRQDILKRFGAPEHIFEDRYFYFNRTLSVFFSKSDKVNTIIIEITPHKKPPPDTIPADIVRKAFIGRPANDVVKTFGQPDRISSDNYQYRGLQDTLVEFQCYDFNNHICSQIWIQFFD